MSTMDEAIADTFKPRRRLIAAIRRQTVEAPNDEPNGPTEDAWGQMSDMWTHMGEHGFTPARLRRFGDMVARFGTAWANDVGELQRAADGYFGEDFTAPGPDDLKVCPWCNGKSATTPPPPAGEGCLQCENVGRVSPEKARSIRAALGQG